MIESRSNFGIAVAPLTQSDFSEGHKGSMLSSLTRELSSYLAYIRTRSTAAIQSQIGGHDSRIPVFNTRKAPYRMICALELDFGPSYGKFHGTGWLAGPNTVVSAGHCIFDARMGWAKTIAVEPGRNGDGPDARPFGSKVSTRFSVAQQWEAMSEPAFDIGCIHLDNEWGNTLGWFPFGTIENHFTNQQELHTSGYSDYFAKNSIPTKSEGVSVGVAQGRLFYTLDTQRGASGAPIMLKSDTPRVVAVHAYDEEEQTPEIPEESNSGPWLGKDMVDLINRWNDAS